MVSAESLSHTPIGVLTGPTASGKSAVALELARGCSFIEIINADSLLVYRGLDIGTAKPNAAERASVPHHLIDVRDLHETFTAGDYYRAGQKAITVLLDWGEHPLWG